MGEGEVYNFENKYFMISIIIKDYLDLLNNKVFPKKLYLDYNAYSLLCKEIEKENISTLFDLEIVLRKKYIYKFI